MKAAFCLFLLWQSSYFKHVTKVDNDVLASNHADRKSVV